MGRHTYTSLHYHCVFGTLGRRNLIVPALKERIHGCMGGIVNNLQGLPIRIGGTRDHVHILCALRADMSPAEAVQKIKANTTGWIHKTLPSMDDFAWQEGYGGFTVSRSNIDAVADYIANQEVHHRTMTFQEEFLLLLKKHDVQYDPATIWE